MITGIRIEHPNDGFGIFWGREKGSNWYEKGYVNALDQEDLFNYSSSAIGGLNDRHEKMTVASDIKGFTTKHLCAYSSMEHLNEFIKPNELKKLIKLGFKVYNISVSTAITHWAQFLFLKEDIIEKQEITKEFLTNKCLEIP